MKSPTIIIFAIVLNACGMNHGNSGHTNASGSRETGPVDRDGNKYPTKRLLDGKLWMTTNLNSTIEDSYCYENAKENCERYGRLYLWVSARQGCAMLGEGWRLPSDSEWHQLVKLYGGVAADFSSTREKAYQALLYPGTSGFNAALGGNREPGGVFARKEAHGFYWTATENDSSAAWYYNFGKSSKALFQQDGGEKKRAFSVRCVNSLDSLK